MNFTVMSSNINNPVVVFLIVLGVAVLIAVIAFAIYKVLHLKMKNDKEKPSEEEAVKEELDRILKPIEDDKTAKEVDNYKSEDDE